MCGFCGIVGENPANDNILDGMMERIVHRGPDSDGKFVGEGVALGFRRLALVGLTGGTQPVYNEDKSCVLVLNGEIYNHRALREALAARGHVIRSTSDAEVVLHLYEDYGADALGHLRGMFAFALYDMRRKRLFCARDPFGIKPLYWMQTAQGLIFASEIKSLCAHPDFTPRVNLDALDYYLSFQYSPTVETFFSGVHKLMPGHYLSYEAQQVSVVQYHKHDFAPQDMDFDAAVDSVSEALHDSVRAHMEADVEIGAFLSGGVDSGLLAATFGGSKTFSVGFEQPGFSEIEHAKSLNIDAENFSAIIGADEFFDALPKIQYHMDEPLADPAAAALYFVCRLAAEHVKSVISGEGADELFGGYNIYREPAALAAYQRAPRWLRRILGAAAEALPPGMRGRGFLMRGARTLQQRYIGGAYVFDVAERNRILAYKSDLHPHEITGPVYARFAHHDCITQMQLLDIHLWLHGDILLKADKMSMAHSLEVRVPFLDTAVFRAASRLPTKYRCNADATKYALRHAAARHMPRDAAFRHKLGFPVPIAHWLREDKYHDMVRTAFISPRAQEFFNPHTIMQLLTSHKSGRYNNARKIWALYMFLLWHEAFWPA